MRHQHSLGRSGEPSLQEGSDDETSLLLSDFQSGTKPLSLGEILDQPSPRHFRRLLEDAAAVTNTTERQVILRLATELFEDVEAEAQLPASLLSDLRAELSLAHALHHLAQGATNKARPALHAALDAAHEGSGDVLLLGHVHEAVAQLALLTHGPLEAERRLLPAIELFRTAEQQPELASALFRAAAWRLEARDRAGFLSRVREALASFELSVDSRIIQW